LDLLTISLMLTAGLLHANWHSLVKSGENGIAILAGMGAVAGICAAAALPFVPFPAAYVRCYRLACTSSTNYAWRAPMRGHFGKAFPLARGMLPLFATLIAFVGLGQVPSSHRWAGVVLASCGLLLLALDRLQGRTRLSLLIAAASAGAAVASYSVIDAFGTRLNGNWFGFSA
jgi:drug/metabolite transporter (DMT)-like permease